MLKEVETIQNIKEQQNTLNKPYNSTQYADFAIYCNENNLSIQDKGTYLEGVKREINLDELKSRKLQELKQANENYIYSIYPQYKQNNIAIFGTEEEREKFKEFLRVQIAKYDFIFGEINRKNTVKSLQELEMV